MKMNALNEWKFMSHLRTGKDSLVENGKRRISCRLDFVLLFDGSKTTTFSVKQRRSQEFFERGGGVQNFCTGKFRGGVGIFSHKP